MGRLVFAVSLALSLGLGDGHALATAPIPTVLGKGPELHLFPSFGPVGTRVVAVGLGYRPGAHVRIVYGPPNSEFDAQPLSRPMVGTGGRFFARFTVTRRLLLGHATQPLILGAFETGKSGQASTATTAFIVTPA